MQRTCTQGAITEIKKRKGKDRYVSGSEHPKRIPNSGCRINVLI